MTMPSQTIEVIAISPGIAIGRVMRIRSHTRLQEPEPHPISAEEVPGELERFNSALALTRVQLNALQNKVRSRLNAGDADIFAAHLMLAEDRTLLGSIERIIKEEHLSAENAIFRAGEHFADALSALPDEYLRERAADVRDVVSRIMANLAEEPTHSPDLDSKRIIVAQTLTPSETVLFDRNKILGFAVETGSATSHTAILARSLQLPAVAGIPPELPEQLTGDDKIIIDGFAGKLIINPDVRTEEAYRLKREAAGELRNALARESALEPETTDGFLIQLAANLDAPEHVAEARQAGARGVGLFRTEYLYLNRDELPTEEEQFEVYKKLLTVCEDAPVIIRTLDVGGDKFNTNIYRSNEANPFLGLRGIRLCIHERRDIFETQLRALLRAGVFGNLRVMLPMVSSVDEVLTVKKIIAKLQQDLAAEHREFVSNLSLGVMIETPAAALLAERFAPLVDFFSIGTNDLVQYTMAIDRGNERVAYLYRPSHPAILELIHRCVLAAEQHNIWVSICGQMAADATLTPLLVGLGVHELSMSAASIGPVRRVIRSISMYEAENAARAALACNNSFETLAIAQELLMRCAPEIAGIQEARRLDG